jgi:hypothetical protein
LLVAAWGACSSRVAVLLLGCFVLLSVSALAQSTPFTIGIRDACDPGTFTAAVGPGICRPGQHGTTKHKFFIAELQSDHIAGAWRFNPQLDATQGTFQLATVSLSSGQTTALCKTLVAKPTPLPRSQISEGDSFRHSISCRETRFRLRSACNRETQQIYLSKPALPRPDRQQARRSSRLALPIGNAAFTPGCA